MTTADFEMKVILQIEQTETWLEISHEIDSWFNLLDTLRKEYDEKYKWAQERLNAAMEKLAREDARFNEKIKEIDDKYKGTA